MGKLRKLRSRFISSVGAVKRSILRMQSQGSAASNSTTAALMTVGGEDVDESSPLGALAGSNRRNGGLSIWRKIEAPSDESQSGKSLQLHWSEGRRIYSEPVRTVEQVNSQSSASGSSSPNTGKTKCKKDSRDTSTNNTVLSQAAEMNTSRPMALDSAEEIGVAACSLSSDEEENDDVFLESWEDHLKERGLLESNLSIASVPNSFNPLLLL